MSFGQVGLMAVLAGAAPAAIPGVQAFQQAQAAKKQADLEADLLNQQAESVRLVGPKIVYLWRQNPQEVWGV